MKQYDRDKKKWVSASDIERKVKKRALCKGGREHDWLLCLPVYVREENSVLGLGIAERYYAIEAERRQMNQQFDTQLEALGIKNRYRTRDWRAETRYYICSVCQKQESQTTNKKT